MAEVHIIGVQFRQPANQPVLLLRESAGDRYLPIWIGDNEAKAIMLEQQGVEPPRPLTHDLFRDVIGALGHSLKEVRIVALQEGTFYADLLFDHDVRVSARPSAHCARTRSRSSRNSSTASRRTISRRSEAGFGAITDQSHLGSAPADTPSGSRQACSLRQYC